MDSPALLGRRITLDRHIAQLRPIFGIDGLGSSSGRLFGYSELMREFKKLSVRPRQVMRHNSWSAARHFFNLVLWAARIRREIRHVWIQNETPASNERFCQVN